MNDFINQIALGPSHKTQSSFTTSFYHAKTTPWSKAPSVKLFTFLFCCARIPFLGEVISLALSMRNFSVAKLLLRKGSSMPYHK